MQNNCSVCPWTMQQCNINSFRGFSIKIENIFVFARSGFGDTFALKTFNVKEYKMSEDMFLKLFPDIFSHY